MAKYQLKLIIRTSTLSNLLYILCSRVYVLSSWIYWFSADIITLVLVFVPIVQCKFKMLFTIEIPRTVKCGLQYVFNARSTKAAVIHRQISDVHRNNAMREGIVGNWVVTFKEGRNELSLIMNWFKNLWNNLINTSKLCGNIKD